MRRPAHSLFLILLIGLFAAQPALAYEYPLSTEAIRDAYFLGKAGAAKREAFFAQYTQHLARPKSGPYISLIRIETPFSYVAERTARSVPNLLAPDAVQKFYGKPLPLRIRVRIDLTPTYGWQVQSSAGSLVLRSPDFWRDFDIRLIQRKTIPPVAEHGTPDYSFAGDGSSSVLVGADVELEYDPAAVRSAPATVVVDTPDGQQIEAAFDLANLR
jgi:hypothetical protein